MKLSRSDRIAVPVYGVKVGDRYTEMVADLGEALRWYASLKRKYDKVSLVTTGMQEFSARQADRLLREYKKNKI